MIFIKHPKDFYFESLSTLLVVSNLYIPIKYTHMHCYELPNSYVETLTPSKLYT